MESTVLSAESRTERGKGPARRLRAQGKIPAVVYGHNDPVTITLDTREFNHVFHAISESTIITLRIGKKDVDVLIKDYDEDIQTGKIRHVDFFEIERGKKLRTRVAIILRGSPIGVREGGVLEHSLHDVEIECLPKDIPENLIVDVTGLALGHSLHISDIDTPEGVEILSHGDQTIAVVSTPRAAIEEIEEEEVEEEAIEGEEEASEEE